MQVGKYTHLEVMYLPLYGHQFSGLVTSPHQHATVGAVTQLLQGGVAVHRRSGWSHQPNLFAKTELPTVQCRSPMTQFPFHSEVLASVIVLQQVIWCFQKALVILVRSVALQ